MTPFEQGEADYDANTGYNNIYIKGSYDWQDYENGWKWGQDKTCLFE